MTQAMQALPMVTVAIYFGDNSSGHLSGNSITVNNNGIGENSNGNSIIVNNNES
jgi:hypothetical protein